MIDSPLRALTKKGGILWCYNSGRSNKNLMRKKKKKEKIFPNPKPTLIHSFFEGLALIPALYLHSEERLLLECVTAERLSLWHGTLKCMLGWASKKTATRETKNGIEEGIV